MRNELALSSTRARPTASDSYAWAIVSFCLIGLVMSLYFIFSSLRLDDDIPLLIMQYGLG